MKQNVLINLFLIENNLFVNDKILKYCKTRQTFKKKINF